MSCQSCLLLRRHLEDLATGPDPRKSDWAVELLSASSYNIVCASPESILSVVCLRLGVTTDALKGRMRTGEIAEARAIAMFLVRKRFGWSFQRIALLFGGRDHTTVISAIKGVEGWLASSDRTRALIAEIEGMLL